MVCMDSALQGLTQSLESFDRAANRIARMPLSVDPQSPQGKVTQRRDGPLMVSQNNYEANIRTIRTADEMSRSLIDLLAA